MRLNKRVEEILNKQINAEMWSAYLYLSMSAYYESKGLKGFANWMRIQYQEETSHALKFFDFLYSRGASVKLEPIASVPTEWNGIIAPFEDTYNHECVVTDLIHKCYEVSIEEKDHATSTMLQWFINEQAEEEQTALTIIEQIKMLGEQGQALYLLDKEFATRVFVDKTKVAI